VTDAERAVEGLGLEEAGEAVIDLALAFAELERVIGKDANAGAVVSAIFESTEAFEDDGAGLLFADVTYDATHGILLDFRFAICDLRLGIADFGLGIWCVIARRLKAVAGFVPSPGFVGEVPACGDW
jgi:hypothetical protein